MVGVMLLSGRLFGCTSFAPPGSASKSVSSLFSMNPAPAKISANSAVYTIHQSSEPAENLTCTKVDEYTSVETAQLSHATGGAVKENT